MFSNLWQLFWSLFLVYSSLFCKCFPGDLVSPGLFKDFLTTQDTSKSYHDSAEGYIFEFAVNLETIDYLQTINLLKVDELNTVLEYMQTSMSW